MKHVIKLAWPKCASDLKLANQLRLFYAHAATTTLLQEDESLQVLQQKQLFIPRSKIQNLIEIGKG